MNYDKGEGMDSRDGVKFCINHEKKWMDGVWKVNCTLSLCRIPKGCRTGGWEHTLEPDTGNADVGIGFNESLIPIFIFHHSVAPHRHSCEWYSQDSFFCV